MTTYSLKSLLTIRTHKKTAAESELRDAILAHAVEKARLEQIHTSIKETIGARAALQHNFFLKAQQTACNKREIICHVSSNQKNILDETSLRRQLSEQEELLRCTALKIEIAKASVVDAHRNLKVIEKHYESWQQGIRKAEDIREEYRNDDQNSVRFITKKV